MGIESSRATIQPSRQDKQTTLDQVRSETRRLCRHENSLSSGHISALSARIGRSQAQARSRALRDQGGRRVEGKTLVQAALGEFIRGSGLASHRGSLATMTIAPV